MKATAKSLNNTSFSGVTISATLMDLIKVLGAPHQYDSGNKTNFEWEMETEDGNVFAVYDWKLYYIPEINETIDWHIGSHGLETAKKAKQEIVEALKNI